jgi:RNA polymerase sigma-70 factor (ECF subfamily)
MEITKPSEQQRPDSTASQILQWVVQAQAGDRTAFHRLADHYQAEIFRMIFFRTRSKMDAEDLTQDVFLQAFKNLKRLKEPKVFRSWLYRIAVNRVCDFHRRKKFRALFGVVSLDDQENRVESRHMAAEPQAPDQLERQAFWRTVNQCMQTLARSEREVFLLRFFDQLSIKEITTTLGKNESTVKTHLYRALKKVKNAMSETEGAWEGIR